MEDKIRLIDGLKFIETCHIAPLQYDVYNGDEKVAYFRLRHGRLLVHPYVHTGKELGINWTVDIYAHYFDDTEHAWLDDDEQYLMADVALAINDYLEGKVRY